jgi:transcriptional regulator with XRE-family HTH domain
MDMPEFDAPAASQYAATAPELLRWFDGYNDRQPNGQRVFPFGFLLSLQAKSRIEMAKDEPEALSHELWRRREPRSAAPYYKRPSEAKDHAFDRERGGSIPASWLKSQGRSLVRYHMHPETKFRGGEYEQRGPLRRRHVFALAQQSIGKEADNIEENEFIGEDAGPREFGVPAYDRPALPAAVFEIQKRYGISDRRLLEEAKVSHHTLAGLREGKRIADASLMKLFRAAEALRQEADPIAAAMEKALEELRWLRDGVGGRNRLAKLLGVTGPYLGRVLCGEKPMTKELVEKLAQSRDKLRWLRVSKKR